MASSTRRREITMSERIFSVSPIWWQEPFCANHCLLSPKANVLQCSCWPEELIGWHCFDLDSSPGHRQRQCWFDKKFKLDQVNCAKVKYSHYIVYLKNLHPLKKITLEKYSSLKASRPWKIFTHEKYSPLKNNHPWKIFTPEKYSPLKNIHSWKYSPRINIHSWKIVTPEKYSLLKNIHSWKIFTPGKYWPLKNIQPQ